MSQLEERAVAGRDDYGGERELGKSLQLEGESPVGESGAEVIEALAFDRDDEVSSGARTA